MSEAKPATSSKKRISPLWIIPLVAAVAGIWMVVHAYMTEGPTVTITFANAEGLAAGKTKVRILNVDVGMVEAVELNEDVTGVRVVVKLDAGTRPLLREDTRFWVVKARVGASGVSGLNTLLSGAYIEMAPGSGKDGRRNFTGLEQPPLTAAGSPGLHLTLVTDEAGSVSTGDRIYYRGLVAGRVESTDFSAERSEVHYTVFIDTPFDELITTSTRFWNSSGIAVDASAEGIALRVGALDSVLSGGVTFATLPELPPGEPVADREEFRLHPSFSDVLADPYEQGMYFVVELDGDVTGLRPGAPVSFRGLKVGRVVRILRKELAESIFESESPGAGPPKPIPVLVYLQPGRLEAPDSEQSVQIMRDGLRRAVGFGMRATLRSGNLLTGSKEIYLGFFPNAPPAEMGRFRDYDSIPSVDSGLGEIQQQFSNLLRKINELPIEDTVTGANSAIASLDETLNSIDGLLKADGMQALPGELRGAVEELERVLSGFSQDSAMYQELASTIESLNRTLQNLDRLSRELADRPNAVIFSPPAEEDPIPEAPR